jgi:hypothetical protein
MADTSNSNCRVCTEPGQVHSVVVLVVVVIVVLVSLFESQTRDKPRTTNTSTTPTNATSTSPAVAADPKAEVLKRASVLSDAMRDMQIDIAGRSIDTIVLVIETFNLGATVVRDAALLELSPDERKTISALRTSLLRRQAQTFPRMRKRVGPMLASMLWESDIAAETHGTGYSTVQFVGGPFAAHRNIAAAQKAIYPLLMRLRFKRVEYKWIPSEAEYTYYDVASPSDSALAVVGKDGSATLVNDAVFSKKSD